MGVKGLWRLLMPIGRRISIETLEGKILAIDASVWLLQFLKAMKDPDTGSTKPAAHLIGFFRRLAKLRYHGIRPILVFDGITPEIKRREVRRRQQRREQFAPSTASGNDDGGIQRLAKRLLLGQLKKKRNKKTTSIQSSGGDGAYDSRFIQPADDDDGKEESSSCGDNNKKESTSTTTTQSSIDVTHEAIMAEMAGLEDEWKENNPVEEADNDWDKAVVESSVSTEQQQNDEPTTVAEQHASSSIYNFTNDTLNVRRLSALPSHERKDAVEAAQRQQRMRSRREFMPVAGQPQEYSQVQLRNFLRASRLNNQIHAMAKQVADEGNDYDNSNEAAVMGERMASDATRRIILTKHNNNEKEDLSSSSSSSSSNNPWKRLKKRASAFRTNKLPPEEEDDEEFEWQDGEPASTIVAKANKSKMTPFSNARTNSLVEEMESDSDDGGGGGGFLPPSPRNATGTTAATKPAPVIQIDSDESDSEGESGGGFITTAHSKGTVPTKTIIDVHGDDDDGDDDSRRGGSHTSLSADAKRAQEMEDEMLARALQEEEDEGRGGGAQADQTLQLSSKDLAAEQTMRQIDRDAALAESLAAAETANLQSEFAAIDEALDGDSDDIDWEDGDDEDADDSGLDDESDRKPAGVPSIRHESPPRPSRRPTLPLQVQENADDSETDDIAWEDGDQVTSTNGVRHTSLKSVVTESPEHSNFHSTSNGNRNSGDTQRQSKSDSDDERDVSNAVPGVSDFDDVQLVDQNTMALEHAQTTAANLTNWAGRAFRRAMAQHAEETGVTSPEKVRKTPSVATERGPVEDNSGDESIGLSKEAYQPSTKLKNAPGAPVGGEKPPPMPTDSNPNYSVASTDGNRGESASSKETFGGFWQDTSTGLQEQEDMVDAETRRQERDMETITDELKSEVIQLIQLFGIPYVESPAEAEAQCAKLEELGLVDGIVTEDSDVFVFGGSTVYKNIFDDQKYVEVYLASDAQRDLALNRNQMVALAMLLGGDYTEGVKGVGIVNGMEVLQAFDCSRSVKEGLTKFRKWMHGFDPDDAKMNKSTSKEGLSVEQKFRLKHKSARTQWIAPKYFPAENVMNAYLKPVVDASSKGFSWGTPDLEKLLTFCQRNMGWEHDETRRLMEPVMQRLEDTSRQTRLDSFLMKYEDDLKFAAVKSKRLREVFRDIHKDQSAEANESPKKRAKNDSTS